MRILVTGSRYATLDQHFGAILGVFQSYITHNDSFQHELVVGDATGVDEIAALIWRRFKIGKVEMFQANWESEGKAAGPLRNKAMVDSGADVALAFPIYLSFNRGTFNCAGYVMEAGIPLIFHNLARIEVVV